jgi:hypothetical protein
MWRVLESSDVENQSEIAGTQIAANGREVSAAGLTQRGAVVGRHNDGIATSCQGQRLAPVIDARNISAVRLHIRAIATRQAIEFIETQSASAHVRKRNTAIQQIFRKPTPGAFPCAFRVNG